jgi:sensor histidine kinase YesM
VKPPRPGRSYWVCQIAGWGSFTAYVLGGYLLAAPEHDTGGFFGIVFTNALVCPAISHELRRQIYLREWLQRPLRRVGPILVLLPVLIAAALTAVGVGVVVVNHVPITWGMLLGTFFAFLWAFAGWLVIYFAVHGRRRREALQLELAVVSRDAQLRTLRTQVNPHFLFNSLTSLRHLIVTNPDRAVTMVTGLADLLRYSLASDREDTVPLSDELAIVDEYLGLEQIRFEERLRVERAIEPAALTARVPPMLVQSLVDNAIKHGIATLARGGVVRLSARVTGTAVDLTVANSGVFSGDRAGGYGLANARERLRLLYDGAASLTLRQDGDMTVADVHIPAAPAADVTSRR